MSAVQTQTSVWKIDPAHSAAEFKVRHMMISNVKGQFNKIDGVLDLDEADIAQSKIRASIDAGSVSTREDQRDAHLRSADFFDVEKYPALTFESTEVRGEAGDLKVAGNLTIHGVTRPVVFEVEGPTPAAKDPWGNLRIGLSATTRINRKDFGLGWNAVLETGGILVGDEVAITLDLQFVRS